MAHGGARENAGRKPGKPNKVTAEVRELAGKYGPDAIKALAKLAGLSMDAEGKAESEAARVAAIKELLDRAYGKSAQPIDGDGAGGPIEHLHEIRRTLVRPDHTNS